MSIERPEQDRKASPETDRASLLPNRGPEAGDANPTSDGLRPARLSEAEDFNASSVLRNEQTQESKNPAGESLPAQGSEHHFDLSQGLREGTGSKPAVNDSERAAHSGVTDGKDLQRQALEQPGPETSNPPVEYGTVREALLQNIDDPSLRNHAKELYKEGAREGDGGTAAALFHEKETGELVGGKPHEIKSFGHERGLGKLVNSNEMNATDREIAKDLREDLQNALNAERKRGLT